MYKILIVDDEYLSRFVLKTVISKRISNAEIVGEAENGRQAVAATRELKPDLVIMDIKMPGLNGIEASREILREFPDKSVLILTAYDNFDYIKAALDLGVKGYILKPVKEEEVVEKVNKILKDMDEKSNKLGLEEQIENKIKVVKPLIESELISSLMSEKLDVEKIENYARFLQTKIRAGYFMLISPGHLISKSIDDSIRNRILKDKIYKTAEKHLPFMKKCYFGNSSGNTFVAYFPVEEGIGTNELIKEAVVIGEEIKARIKVIANIDVAVGIGNISEGIQNQYKSYNEANIALRQALKGYRVLPVSQADELGLLDQAKYPFELESKLFDQIKIGNSIKTAELVDEVITYIFTGNYKIELIKESVLEFLMTLKRTALKSGVMVGAEGSYEMALQLGSLNSVDEVNEWCKRYAYEFVRALESKSYRNRDVLAKAFEIIDKNFTGDITLESVASDAGVSPQYLSKVFKEGYGSNFIDYVTDKRISYAKELLHEDRISIKEISIAAGYVDPNYFCKIFKKYTGLTPKQFRMQKIE